MWGMILECGYSVPLLVPKVRRSYLDPCLNWIPFFEGCFYIHFLTKFQTNEKQNRKQISAPVLMHARNMRHVGEKKRISHLIDRWSCWFQAIDPLPLWTSATSTKLFWFCTKCIFDSRSIGDCKGHSSCTNLGAARMMFSPLMFFLSGRWFQVSLFLPYLAQMILFWLVCCFTAVARFHTKTLSCFQLVVKAARSLRLPKAIFARVLVELIFFQNKYCSITAVPPPFSPNVFDLAGKPGKLTHNIVADDWWGWRMWLWALKPSLNKKMVLVSIQWHLRLF